MYKAHKAHSPASSAARPAPAAAAADVRAGLGLAFDKAAAVHHSVTCCCWGGRHRRAGLVVCDAPPFLLHPYPCIIMPRVDTHLTNHGAATNPCGLTCRHRSMCAQRCVARSSERCCGITAIGTPTGEATLMRRGRQPARPTRMS